MANVKVFTDSTADIPADLVKELDISVVPLKVHIHGETYLDGVTLSAEQFYQKLKTAEELPTTSQPSPLDFAEAYRKAIYEGATEIFSIHLSSALSGTYQSALLAKSMVEEEIENVKISVYDSKTVAYALGIIVVASARAAKEGKSLEDIHILAEKYRNSEVLLALVDTLEYLQKGGRIGRASALLGSLLNIKPIISLSDDGVVCSVDKARGKNKAVNRMFELMQEQLPQGSVSAAILHTGQLDEAEKLLEKIKSVYDVKDAVFAYIGPVVGTHAGPGTIACLVVPLDEK